MLVDKASKPGDVRLTGLVRAAHRAGLVVHPYTFRLEQAALPAFAASPDQLLEILWNRAHIDGLFTDFPDRVDQFLKSRESKTPQGP
jgi:glycerophosphoryl diester phosphodiesterase